MQYILTEQEYKALAPISEVNKLKEEVQLLNDKVMELSEHPCGSTADYRSMTFYCDDCPIGRFGLNTCTERQQYSK
ncbi:hypothetical protein [uncultured Parabacteroides sp.]|uniref:hypothetical protein n=1 Tax=uncultured Parabacteroides sp. TaxID=512312 RepID=UPI00262B913D|nr:hypothetical protein [uncultured Parabacteroides sp.]